VIQREIETPLSRRMMHGEPDADGLLRVRIEADALSIERES
jgi:hypothetical protein